MSALTGLPPPKNERDAIRQLAWVVGTLAGWLLRDLGEQNVQMIQEWTHQITKSMEGGTNAESVDRV